MFLVALLVGLGMPMMAQTSYTFNVASLNVGGVPQNLDYKIANPNALEGAGTKIVSQKVAMQNWSVVGLCEDYNYHTDLMSAIGNYFYDFNENAATLTTGNDINDTDGLGILVAKSMGTSNSNLTSTPTRWSDNTVYGSDADYENRELSRNGDTWAYRGFRRYTVTLPNVGKVYVYVLHMDAGDDLASGYTTPYSRSVNSATRETQLGVLANKIIYEASGNCPAIVMGMTNCLYTREQLKTKFIDVINANNKLTVNDAWVELKRGGKYPVYNTDAEIPGNFYYDDQNGEVVNKIFYINNTGSEYTIKANSYIREITNFGNLKNAPVVVNFTIAKKGEASLGSTSTIKDTEGNDVKVGSDWIVNETLQKVVNTYSGEALRTDGSSVAGRFLMNLASGLYLNIGGKYATQATEGSEAMPLTIAHQGGSTYTMQALTGGFVYHPDNNGVYMDRDFNHQWQIKKVPDSDYNQYNIYYIDGGVSYALTSTGDASNTLTVSALEADNDRQKWIILSDDVVRTTMTDAKASAPFDVTPFVLSGASFNNNIDNHTLFSGLWQNTNLCEPFLHHSISGGEIGANTAAMIYKYTEYNQHVGESKEGTFVVLDWIEPSFGGGTDPNFGEMTITSSAANMPKGKYTLSFEGVYSARAYGGASSGFGNGDCVLDVTMSLNNVNANVIRDAELGLHDGAKNDILTSFRDNDKYKNSLALEMTGKGDLIFKFHKPAFTEGSDYLSQKTTYTESGSWLNRKRTYTLTGYDQPRRFLIAIDNIVIKYYGDSDNADIYVLISNYLYETALKVAQLNEAGQAAYDVSEVVGRYTYKTLSADGSAEIAMIDAAYEIALRAHNAQKIEGSVTGNDGDVSYLITNPSFEQGITGWTVGAGWDCGVRDNGAENSTFYVSNAHSDVDGETKDQYQLYNGYAGDGAFSAGAGAVTQTITGLKNGLYELTALVTSFGPGEGGLAANDPGNTVYLIGNNYHAGVVAQKKTYFEKASLLFLVEDGTATIGAQGGVGGYFYSKGCFFKADNFRLKYICDIAHGRVYLAHKEAKAVYDKLDKFGKEYANADVDGRLGKLLTKYANADEGNITSLAGSNGVDEAAEIYNQLTEASFRQQTIGSDMTWCFGDPSFEIGKYTQYWKNTITPKDSDTEPGGGDFIASKQSDESMAAVGVHGSYLYNGFSWDSNPITLSATIGLNNTIPNGIYRISAKVTSHSGCKVFIETGTVNINNKGEITISNTSCSNTEAVADYKDLEAARWMNPISHEFEVTNGTVQIKVYAQNADGEPYHFFKADDFHLELVLLASNQKPTEKYEDNSTLYLDENSVSTPILPRSGGNFDYTHVKVKREIKKETWSTLVLPFTMNVSALGKGWIVKELESAKLEDNEIKLVFTSVTDGIIEQGKCYLVRNNDVTVDEEGIYALQELNAEIVEVDGTRSIRIGNGDDDFDKTFNNSTDLEVTYHGTYYSRYVPKDAWFVTGNKFKYATGDATNRIKGFRAYFTAPINETTGSARGFGFRIDESTGVDATNKDEVTVVGIYNLSGMRLTDMEPGVNILQMSDGTSVKVIIK